MKSENKNNIGRRGFLKLFGSRAAAASAIVLTGCVPKQSSEGGSSSAPTGGMTYRKNRKGDSVSLLGYGMMRLPTEAGASARDAAGNIDQEMVNRQIDYALEHGVNYFDTSPAYCRGLSEKALGTALSRHNRNEFYVATKLSNFSPDTWSREASIAMYHNSFKELQVDYIDYLLLHGIGMGGMESFNSRYIDNGVLDYLLKEREAGRIRNLGFSYHGDVKVFDYLLSCGIQWDFAQIQMNYVDWNHAKEVNPRNTDAEYLYNELNNRGIPVVVMEPLLGGRLASLNKVSSSMLTSIEPDSSMASWAFRFIGSYPGIMTILSGMTYMEHLQENVRTFSPLRELSNNEFEVLKRAALAILKFPLVPCNTCQYCMPCPYGLDIPGIFTHYNKCLNEGNAPVDSQDENYRHERRAFLVGYDRSVPKLRQANHCIGCRKCIEHCPQRINIPAQMRRIDRYVEELKQS